MFNIGLESLQQINYVGSGDEYSAYELKEIIDNIGGYFDTINNMLIIKKSLETYGNTPQLKDLVGKSFEDAGITFSTESIVETIKQVFVWIKEKIVAMWKAFWRMFGFYKDEDKKMEADIKSLEAKAASASVATKVRTMYVEKLRKISDDIHNNTTSGHSVLISYEDNLSNGDYDAVNSGYDSFKEINEKIKELLNSYKEEFAIQKETTVYTDLKNHLIRVRTMKSAYSGMSSNYENFKKLIDNFSKTATATIRQMEQEIASNKYSPESEPHRNIKYRHPGRISSCKKSITILGLFLNTIYSTQLSYGATVKHMNNQKINN